MPATTASAVVIDRRWLNLGLLAFFMLIWLPVWGMATWFLSRDFAKEPTVYNGALVVGVVGFLAIMMGYVVFYLLFRSASRARFGKRLQLGAVLRQREAEWSEVGRLVLKEQATPIPTACILKLVLTDGTRFEVYASRDEAEAVFELAHERGWARDWPGAPLARGTVAAILGLGIIALAASIWVDAMMLRDLWQRGDAALAAPGPPIDGRALVLVAVGGPLLGLTSLGFGLYHLVRRPIMLRAGLVRLREGEAAGDGGFFKNLFGTQE